MQNFNLYIAEKPRKELYQDFADIINIFWAFHKSRVISGNIPQILLDGCNSIAFNTKAEEDIGGNVLRKFENSLSWTLETSWITFLRINGISFGESVTEYDIQETIQNARIPESLIIFRNNYISDIVKSIEKKYKNESDAEELRPANTNAESIVIDGIKTGAEFGVHLKGLFGKDFRPALNMWVAKTSLKKIDETSRLLSTHSTEFPIQQDDEKYVILDDTKGGLNTRILRELGMGTSVGCPSAIMPSKKTQDFLREILPDYKARPMLQEFSTYLEQAYELHIEDWFNSLPDDRLNRLDDNIINLLDGSARKDAISRNIAREGYSNKELY